MQEVQEIVESGSQAASTGSPAVLWGLILLIGCAYLLYRLKARSGPKSAPAAVSAPVPEVMEVQEDSDEGELVAVISAAIAAMLEAEQAQAADPDEQVLEGFVVRSIRRVGNTPAWSRAGREEQVYSRL